MNTNTPANTIRKKDLDLNTEALRECLVELKKARKRVHTVLDIRYGLGGWAQVTFELLKPKCYVGFEADLKTYRESWKPKTAERFELCQQFFEPTGLNPFDMVLADFNNLTMMKPKDLLQVLAFARPRVVIFTDVACSKLHLNFESYGLNKPDLNQYVRAFGKNVLAAWTHLHTARKHHHAATLMFTRN